MSQVRAAGFGANLRVDPGCAFFVKLQAGKTDPALPARDRTAVPAGGNRTAVGLAGDSAANSADEARLLSPG